MKAKLKWAVLAAALLVASWAVYGCDSKKDVSTDSKIVASTQSQQTQPSGKRVTMIDLGATECIPCKMMAPIIEELKKEYAGKADIIFIDVWKNPDQARKYGIRAIPTQIFYDADGKEVHRNVGFMDKKRIVEVLTRLGVS
ncbi:MAG: thioredoxin [Desulfobacteraceae bacterium]|nr:MAG: thioredoxin [Desulfobacteraceae bacterium]